MKKEIVEEMGKDIKERNTMTKEYEGKVNKRIFSNILIAIIMSAYLMVLLLGNQNIERNIFLVDLKILSIVIALISIIIFERSYRKSDRRLCLYGVEFLLLAFMSLTSVYILQMAEDIFMTVICSLTVGVAVYYIIKSIGIYVRSKKKFVESQNDINDIIKEELPETVETKRRRNTLEAEMEEYAKLNAEEESNKSARKITTNIRKREESLFNDEEDDDIDLDENFDDIGFNNTNYNELDKTGFTSSSIGKLDINDDLDNIDLADLDVDDIDEFSNLDDNEDDDELGINKFKIGSSKEDDLEEIKLVENIIEPEKETTTKKKSTTTKTKSSSGKKTDSKKETTTKKSNTKKDILELPEKKKERKKTTPKEEKTGESKKEVTKKTTKKEKIETTKEPKKTTVKKDPTTKSRTKKKPENIEE